MRKTIFTLGLMLAAALSLTNCTKNEEATFTPEVKVPFELYANMDDTRTTNNGLSTKWETEDAINVFHAVADATVDYVNDGKFTTDNGDGKFKGTLAAELEAGTSYDWYVCYPYNSYMTSPNNTTGGRFYIGSRSDKVQTQTGNNSKAHIAGSNYPLYGVAEDVAASETPSITMSHASSLVEFNVTNNLSEAITVNSIVFTVDGNDEKIVGHFYMAIHEGKPTFTDYTNTSNVATLNVTNGEAIAAGASAKFYMAIKPFVADDYALTVAINATSASGTGTCTKELPVVSTTFAPGKIKTLNVGFDAVMEEVTEPETNLISTIDKLTAGQYYMAAYLVSYSSNDWTATPYHLWNGTVNSGDLVTVDYSFNDNVLETSSSDSAAVVTLEAVDGKANTYYVKCGDEYLYSTATATNRKLALSTDPAEWVATNNANGGITLSSNSVYLGTANASSKLLRSYQNEGTLNAGVYFFAVDDVVLVLPPSITAENISAVAAEGVTNETVAFTAKNLTEAITVTCDGDVVNEATITDESTITYSVSENTTELTREGWIKLAANGVEKTITVSQLAPISEPEGETATFVFNQASGSTADTITRTDGPITCVVAKASGSNAPNEHGDGHLRFMAGNTMTISGATITNVQFEFTAADRNKSISANVGTYTKGTTSSTWTGSASEVVFTNIDSAQARVESVTVTYVATGQEKQTLSFDPTEKSANLGEPFTAPTLSGAMTTVKYSSSNTAVATVDENTGAVTLVDAGITTITATAEATEDYFSATASYTLTVIDPNATVDYTTENTSNVTLSTVGGTSAYTNSVQIGGYQYDAIKLGTGSVAGVWKVTVPAGTIKLHLHLAGWNGESVKVGVSGATTASLTLISDSGVSGNGGPFKISTSDSSSFYHELTLSNVTADATLTFTATQGKRFVVWGVNAEIAE